MSIQNNNTNVSLSAVVPSNSVLEYSREVIRNTLFNSASQMFAQQNLNIDVTNSIFGNFLINFMSALASDVLTYSNFLYGESTLITAQLPSTVQNWATYIDYTPQLAHPSQGTLTFVFPYDSAFTVQLTSYTNYFSTQDGIQFTLLNPIRIVNLNGQLTIQSIDQNTNTYTTLPYTLTYLPDGSRAFIFSAAIQNVYLKSYSSYAPLQNPNEYYYIPVTLQSGEELYKAEVYVNGVLWQQEKLILASNTDQVYDILYSNNNTLIFQFGNGIYGQQVSGDEIILNLYLTNGSNGNVQANTITVNSSILDQVSGVVVDYYIYNQEPTINGQDGDTIETIKQKAPLNLRRRYRNVSYQDFIDDLKLNPTIGNCVVILKRSDNATNDVNYYVTINDILPNSPYEYAQTSTISVDITNYNTNFILPYQTPIESIASFDASVTYVCPFLVTINKSTNTYYLFDSSLSQSQPYIQTYSIYSTTNASLMNSNVISLSGLSWNIDLENSLFNISCTVVSSCNAYTSLSIRGFNGQYYDLGQISISNGQNVITFSYSYSDLTAIQNFNTMFINFSYPNESYTVLSNVYTANLSILNAYIDYGSIVTDIDNGRQYLLDLPVITYDYSQQLLSYTLLSDFTNLLQSIYAESLNNPNKTMLNIHSHLKFVRTNGYTNNLQYTTPDIYIKAIVNSQSEAYSLSLNIGDLIAISDPISENDPWYEYAGYLATYIGNVNDTPQFILNKPPQGVIANLNGTNYTVVDTRWIIIQTPLNLPIQVEVYVQNASIPNLAQKYQNAIYNLINNYDIEESIYYSDIIDTLMQIPGTKYVRLITPKFDLKYNYDRKLILKTFTKEEFFAYVPEMLYSTLNNINVIISQG